MILLLSFLVGGLVCGICQIIMDKFRLQPLHITCSLVVLGGILDLFDIYDKLVNISGCGSSLLISSFGHVVVHGTIEKVKESGYLQIFSEGLKLCASGICACIVFSFFISLIFKPKS